MLGFVKKNEIFTFEINDEFDAIYLSLKRIKKILIPTCSEKEPTRIKIFLDNTSDDTASDKLFYDNTAIVDLTISQSGIKIVDINDKVIDTKILNKILNQYIIRNKTNIFDY